MENDYNVLSRVIFSDNATFHLFVKCQQAQCQDMGVWECTSATLEMDRDSPDRWIGHVEQQDTMFDKRLPRSPDLTVATFSFGDSSTTELLYVHYQRRYMIRSDVLQRRWTKLGYRIDICSMTDGAHIECLLFQQLTYKVLSLNWQIFFFWIPIIYCQQWMKLRSILIYTLYFGTLMSHCINLFSTYFVTLSIAFFTLPSFYE